MVMIKLKFTDLRRLVKEAVREQKLLREANKVSDQEFDVKDEARKLVDRWGLDPEEIGWAKIIKASIISHQGNVQKIDAEELLKAIEAEVKNRTKELDKYLEKKRK